MRRVRAALALEPREHRQRAPSPGASASATCATSDGCTSTTADASDRTPPPSSVTE
jgi:hypothetical protein